MPDFENQNELEERGQLSFRMEESLIRKFQSKVTGEGRKIQDALRQLCIGYIEGSFNIPTDSAKLTDSRSGLTIESHVIEGFEGKFLELRSAVDALIQACKIASEEAARVISSAHPPVRTSEHKGKADQLKPPKRPRGTLPRNPKPKPESGGTEKGDNPGVAHGWKSGSA